MGERGLLKSSVEEDWILLPIHVGKNERTEKQTEEEERSEETTKKKNGVKSAPGICLGDTDKNDLKAERGEKVAGSEDSDELWPPDREEVGDDNLVSAPLTSMINRNGSTKTSPNSFCS